MIIEYKGIKPKLAADVFVDETALVIGDVEIGAGSSVWFHSIVRGDVNYIRIGERTNVQDSCVVHVTHLKFPTFIGTETTLGHRVVVHGCAIGDRCLIGIGAIVLDGAQIGDGCIVGAGAVVPPGMKVPAHTLVMGVPAKVIREVKAEDKEAVEKPLKQYMRLAGDYGSRNSN